MKKFFTSIALLCGLFLTFSVPVFAQGREVTIFLKDGTQKSGELLSVRQTLISYVKEDVEDEEDLIEQPELVDVVFLKDIDKVRVEENDVSGAGNGALIGGGIYTGLGIAAFGSDIGNVLLTGMGGAIIGAGIGWVVGLLASEDEEIIRSLSKEELDYLRDYSLCYDGEPDFIRDIINNLLKAQK